MGRDLRSSVDYKAAVETNMLLSEACLASSASAASCVSAQSRPQRIWQTYISNSLAFTSVRNT